MSEVTRIWGGEEWQEHVTLLLKLHYGPGEYVEVPDRDKGDGGLEGYARCGHVYQCYAAEEPAPLAELTKKQKNKITDDLRKFSENKTLLGKLLGTVRISRWILMVPHFDSKELVAHANTKALEINLENLPYVAKDFAVHIETEKCFAVERQQLMGVGLAKADISIVSANDDNIHAWTTQNPIELNKLVTKIAKLPTLKQPEARATFRHQMIRHYLDGQNALAKLKDSYPEQYEQVIGAKNHREQFLATETLLSHDSPSELIQKELQNFKQTISTEVPGISTQIADRLMYEGTNKRSEAIRRTSFRAHPPNNRLSQRLIGDSPLRPLAVGFHFAMGSGCARDGVGSPLGSLVIFDFARF